MALNINNAFRDYRYVVNEYSPRALTKDSDILLACSGYFNNLHQASRNRFICGMSVGLLHDALFWVPSGSEPLQRREPLADFGGLRYPTWSWAGWKGGVKYNDWPSAARGDIEKWTVTSADGRGEVLGELGTPLMEMQNDHIVTHTGSTFFTGRDNIMDPEKELKLQGKGGLPHNILSPCFLYFSTEIAFLRVATGVLDNMNGPMEAIVDTKDRWVGVVLFDSLRPIQERVMNNFMLCIFVAIAIVSQPLEMKKIDGFGYEEGDLMWLNVLAVKEENGCLQRLGVGQVRKSAWQNEDRRKTWEVLLG
jgi:hypothetical protein